MSQMAVLMTLSILLAWGVAAAFENHLAGLPPPRFTSAVK